MNTEWLRTMVAVIDEGSFEAAADELHVSPSAVSQRVKALEAHVGRVLVRRTQPCTLTPAGEAVLRMARQVLLVEDETLALVGGVPGADRAPLPVAVNADSLATWFVPVLTAAAAWPDVVLRLEVEDQAHSLDLLRRGDVVAAVTSSADPLPGCRVEPLGAMRYRPVGAPALVARFTTGDGLDLAAMPMLRYNAKDDLQLDFLRRGSLLPAGVTSLPPQPQVPGSEAFLAAVRAGLGWGMIPEHQLAGLREDELVALPGNPVDVGLYWHVWKLDAARLARLTAAVHEAAGSLRQAQESLAGRPGVVG